MSCVDGRSLGWQLRESYPGTNGPSLWEFYAVAASSLSSDLISCTAGTGGLNLAMTAFGINGADTSMPFDPIVSPVGQGGEGSAPSVTLKTSEPDLLLGVFGAYGLDAETARSGFTLISDKMQPPTSALEYEATSAPGTFTAGISQPSSAYWTFIGDAILIGDGYGWTGYDGNYAIYPTNYTTTTDFAVVNSSAYQVQANGTFGLPNAVNLHTNLPGEQSYYYSTFVPNCQNCPAGHYKFTLVINYGASGAYKWAFSGQYGFVQYQTLPVTWTGFPSDANFDWATSYDSGINSTGNQAGDKGSGGSEILSGVISAGVAALAPYEPLIGFALAVGYGSLQAWVGYSEVYQDSLHPFSSGLASSSGSLPQWFEIDNGSWYSTGVGNEIWQNKLNSATEIGLTFNESADGSSITPGGLTLHGDNQITDEYGDIEGLGASTSFTYPLAPAVGIGGTVYGYSGSTTPLGSNEPLMGDTVTVTLRQDCNGVYTDFPGIQVATNGHWHFFVNPACTYSDWATFSAAVGSLTGTSTPISTSYTSTEGLDWENLPGVVIGLGYVQGQITNATSGGAIHPAYVTLSNSAGTEQVEDSSLGNYLIYVPVTGSYSLEAADENYYIAQSKQLTLDVGTGYTENFSLEPQTGGHGGGCVVSGTPILTPSGYVQIQNLAVGSKVIGYNFTTGDLQALTLVSANHTEENSYLSINGGLLAVTLTDQPIYVLNSTFEGWLRNPQNLTIGDWLFEPASSSWIEVSRLAVVHHSVEVYDVVTSSANDFIGAGVLLDIKA